MTTAGSARQASLSPGKLCFGSFAFFCLVLFFRNAAVAISFISAGLTLCAKTLIPSLFPYLVLSELIVSSGCAEVLLKPISGICKRVLCLPADGCCAMLLGLLCGFPVGARAAVRAYDRGTLTQAETERVLCASTVPSAAFLVNVVGVSMHESRQYGILLLFVSLGSAFLIGVLLAHLPGASRKEHTASAAPVAGPYRPSMLFTEAIRSALIGMLTVCAYVVFFSAFCGTLTVFLERMSLSAESRALLFCLFEISGGVSAAAACRSPVASALLTALAVGWSGISVHCQILSVCGDRPLRMRRYFLCKVLQGGLTVVGFLLVLRRCPAMLDTATKPAACTVVPVAYAPICTLLFLLFLPLLLRKSKPKAQVAE